MLFCLNIGFMLVISLKQKIFIDDFIHSVKDDSFNTFLAYEQTVAETLGNENMMGQLLTYENLNLLRD